MAFCTNCGTEVAGGFCPNCGTPVAGMANPGPGAGAGAAASAAPAQALGTNLASALCYLLGFITGIIFLVLSPYNQNKTIRFHAFQSIFLNVGVFAFYVLWGMFTFVTHGLAFLFYPLFGLFFFVLWLYLMFTAYNGKMVKLPLVGELAEKQA